MATRNGGRSRAGAGAGARGGAGAQARAGAGGGAAGTRAGAELPAWQLHRVLLHPEEIRHGAVSLSPLNSRHVRDVLRLRRGDSLRGLAPSGDDLVLRVSGNDGGRLRCQVTGTIPPLPEPELRVAVCHGLTRNERMEYVLQKGTELGASEFWPLITERTVVRPDTGRAALRLGRWRRIVEEAALQSGRSTVPAVENVQPLSDVIAAFRAQPRDLMFVAYEEETRPLRDVLRGLRTAGGGESRDVDGGPRTAAIVIGPEGGFTPHEVDSMTDAGFVAVSLGPRILRAETAGTAVLAMLLYEFGDLGGPGVCR